MDRVRELLRPYRYGYLLEVTVNEYGCQRAVKHLALGRFSHGAAVVLPDRATVYMTDDEAGGALFKFVSSAGPGDLSAGSLYAAKFTQTADNPQEVAFNLTWIKLGELPEGGGSGSGSSSGGSESSSDDQLQLLDLSTAADLSFGDIWDIAQPTFDFASGRFCPTGYKTLNVRGILECLRLKPGREQAAAFLETRRYAAYLGATTELSATSGITYDAATNSLFLSFRRLERGMTTVDPFAIAGVDNHISLTISGA